MSIRINGRESRTVRRLKLAYLIPLAFLFCLVAGPFVGLYDLLTDYVYQLKRTLR